jgi:hypothetical protein
MPRTALVVPVPEAAAYYDALVGVPAHVTILIPFLEPSVLDEEEIGSVLAPFAAFGFDLVAIERFDDGTRWLRPEPSAPFVELTNAVWRRWPGHPPYGGIHDTVIPHVTITREPEGLPIVCVATEVLLLEEQPDLGWRSLASFALQGVA